MTSFLSNSINKEQYEAITYNDGPLLIIAGAGTGKTYTIIEKIKYLLSRQLAKPEEILALTFTEKAAMEMEERVDQALPYGYFQMTISTFHSFADQILKESISHIGLNPSYQIISDAEAVLFLKDNLFMFNLEYFRPLGNPNKYLKDLYDHFSRLKDEDISPDQYLKWAKKFVKKNSKSDENQEAKKNLELAYAYKLYQELKIKNNLMDFSDLIFYLLELFRKRKNLLTQYRQKFAYIFIDEFQDTNIAQYSLIKLLWPEKLNPKLTVVGDDSQSIYKFRGASVSNIIAFMKDYPQAKQITLRQNYRSNQTILDAAYRLIKHNDPDTLEAKLGISKNLIAHKKDNKKAICFYEAENIEEEADFVAETIIKLRKKYRFSDMAILARNNRHADPFIRTLSQKGIPYQFLGPGSLFKQPEVKDLIAYLKFLNDIGDSVSFFRVLSMKIFDLDPKDIALLISFSKKTNLDLFQATEVYLSFFYPKISQKEFEIYKPYLPLLHKKTREKLYALYQIIKYHLSLVKKETAGQILYFFLKETHYLDKLISYKSEKEEKIALNISKFFNRLKRFESIHEDASIPKVVDYLDMSLEIGESPVASQIDLDQINAVNILTVHSAKGLEFDVVFMVNLSKGRFPLYEKKEVIPIPDQLIKEILPIGDYHLEEERRLFYVAMTRAKEKLYLSYSKFYGEGKRIQKISPFVIEALGEKISPQKKPTEEKIFLSFGYDKTGQIKTKKDVPTLKKYSFSYSEIETYNLCPLQYKYQYIIGIPTTSNAAASFGESIHKTLQVFYTKYLSDKTISQKQLIELYKTSWIPSGYASKAHEERMKKEGEKMLIQFFKTYHHQNLNIIDLEKTFKIKIDNNLIIRGKIDRVDKKGKNEIEIIDYKTGKTPDKNKSDDHTQLFLYALAAMDKRLYHKKINQITLTFYYLQSMEKISIQPSFEEIDKTKEKIKNTVLEIQKNIFNPKVGPWCDFCPFRLLCEAWR